MSKLRDATAVPGWRWWRHLGQGCAAVTLQVQHRLVDHALDDRRRGLDRIDQPGGLAEPDPGVLGVAGGKGLAVTRPLHRDLALQFGLASVPALGEGIAPDARREAARPGDLARDVGHRRAHGAVAVGLDDGAVMPFVHQRLGGCPQPRADERAVGAEHQRRRQAAAVADAAGGQQQRLRRVAGDVVGDLRHEAQRAAQGAVPAGLGTLRHDDVGTDFQRVHHVAHVLALADQPGVGGADLVDEGARVAERKHHCGRPVLQHVGQQRRRLAQRPGDEADPDTPAAAAANCSSSQVGSP